MTLAAPTSSVGAAVRRLRAKLNWSQAGLGERLGVTGGTVGIWESERCTPRVAQLKSLCALCTDQGLSDLSEIFSGAIQARASSVEKRLNREPRMRLRGTHLDAMFEIADAIVALAAAIRAKTDPAWPLAMRDADEAAERHLEAKS